MVETDLEGSENTNIEHKGTKFATFKNLEAQNEQLTKNFLVKVAKEASSSSTLIGHYKAISADNDAQSVGACSNETNELHEVTFISDYDVQVSMKENEGSSRVLPCQLPPKELNP
ncbi:hypothetical protein Tco_1123757 [Tanacetum coccineum]|uniref:Uncharacterized protein n=1 Tax=Tanacetum coccineum TaxID=301880 RepID=A0ABQ5J498_9ASTR